ncbi:MAG: response regulator [Myxococcota bacterium]
MPTLLIVDDETALVRVLREAFELQLPGTVIHSASDWDEAMHVADGLASLDVLLTDQHLGAHTGIELCQALGARFPALRTLIYTGKAGPKVEAAARDLGVRVLWKPLRLVALVAEVRKELEAAGA